MGCYDMVFLETGCPYCERKSKIEFQTNDMNCTFDVFEVGDRVPKEYKDLKYLNAIGDCYSPECLEKSDKLFIIIQGRPSGFGLTFNVRIELLDGVVTGKISNIEITKAIDNYLEENIDKWESIYKQRKKGNLVSEKFKEVI
jgi:hypothetical protein